MCCLSESTRAGGRDWETDFQKLRHSLWETDALTARPDAGSCTFLHFFNNPCRCSLLLRPLLEDYTSRLRSCSRDTETAFLRRVWCGGLPVTGLHTGRRKQKLRETPRIPLCSVPACPKILTPHSAVFCFGPFWKTTPQDCVHVPETQKRPSCGEFGVVAFLSLDCTQGGESRSLEKPQESLFALFQPAPRF
ncbi:uncharacterized protein [Oryctolagus cuniculus]|uniref:uncharacterized protein isoform X2 n=1 Tax=Oryctolagus cuniculus TaxID=9986 RepID=UPI00387A7F01